MEELDQIIHRYPRYDSFSTSMNIDQDLLDLIQGLTSYGVVSDVLSQYHGYSDAKKIRSSARMIVAFVRQGLRFVEQARMGPRIVSFLPSYYSFLQFAKAIIVARLGSAAIHGAITHGLSSSTTAKNSLSLINEKIHVWGGGVFPVFYEVLTGRQLPDFRPVTRRGGRTPKISILMKNVYPFILDTSYEYQRATGMQDDNFRYIIIRKHTEADSRLSLTMEIAKGSKVNLSTSPLFNKIKGNKITLHKGADPQKAIPAYLLYLPLTFEISPILKPSFYYATPAWNGRLHYPEEIPLFLAFFHLGSIVRYKPRFMERIIDSAFNPFILALERHAVSKIFLVFYNEIMQCSHFISRR